MKQEHHHVSSQIHGGGGSAGHASHGAHSGDKHAGHSPAMFRDRFWLSLALTLPIVFFSEMVQEWLGYEAPVFAGSEFIAPLLGLVIFFYGGWPFLKGAVSEIRARRPGMMLLIGMAITVAFGASLATSLGYFNLEFWWELAALITIMLLGHWLEMRAIGQAKGALSALAELLPDTAEIVEGSEVRTVALAELRVGTVALVRPGGRVPADGVIIEGGAEFDESMITGESRPVSRARGARVVAGTVATDSSVKVKVSAIGEETALAGIQRLVAEAQSSHSRAQVLADRAAALLFYVAALSALGTLGAWWYLGQLDTAVIRTVTVLVIACPHALGLAIPLVIAVSTSLSARSGVLVKNRLALERMREIDVVLFDKTGTLTKGEHVLRGVTAVDGDADALLLRAGAVEQESEHPLARAIVSAAKQKGVMPTATGFKAMTGRGVEAKVGGTIVTIGGGGILGERKLRVPAKIQRQVAAWEKRGSAVLYIIEKEAVAGALALEDAIRPESAEAVRLLHEKGVRVAMVTGDAASVAETVGRELGIDEVFAEILPKDKDEVVSRLQAGGQRVAMVGDGVNDAPALARADVGIAIGAGTDVAIESAGIILAGNDPRGVLRIMKLSRASYNKMVQNLAWAAGYNVLAIPLAAGAFAWAGLSLAPAFAAVLMSLSTIVVAVNAQFLRRLDLKSFGSVG